MNQTEFREWIADLRRKSPQLGEWVANLPADTLRDWFQNVFETIELRWARAVNLEIMTGDHDLAGYNRDKLLPTIIRRTSELRYRAEKRLEKPEPVKATELVQRNPTMGPMYRRVCERIREHKEANEGAMPHGDLVHQWTEDAAVEFGL